MPYLFLNLSIRPPVSTSFCLPVKKGWQLLQISTFKTSPSLVVPVLKVAPQAQTTVTSWYLGCISDFMSFTSLKSAFLYQMLFNYTVFSLTRQLFLREFTKNSCKNRRNRIYYHYTKYKFPRVGMFLAFFMRFFRILSSFSIRGARGTYFVRRRIYADINPTF